MKRLNEPLTQPLEYLLYADSGFELSLIAQIRRGWYWGWDMQKWAFVYLGHTKVDI